MQVSVGWRSDREMNMSSSFNDIEQDERSRARERDGWIRGKNGGWLKPIAKGDRLQAGYRKPHALTETLQAARKASPAAIATLVRHLDHPDGRVAVTAANLLLERAWGRPREQPAEEQQSAQALDLSGLTDSELAVLLRLVQSGRLRPAPADELLVDGPTVIEGQAGA
jgi:hypothetical protein